MGCASPRSVPPERAKELFEPPLGAPGRSKELLEPPLSAPRRPKWLLKPLLGAPGAFETPFPAPARTHRDAQACFCVTGRSSKPTSSSCLSTALRVLRTRAVTTRRCGTPVMSGSTERMTLQVSDWSFLSLPCSRAMTTVTIIVGFGASTASTGPRCEERFYGTLSRELCPHGRLLKKDLVKIHDLIAVYT